MGEWKWTTYIFFVTVSFVSVILVRNAEKFAYINKADGIKKYKKMGKIYLAFTYLLLIFFCVIRNIEMYPPYIDGADIQTIDMKAYIYFFQNGLTAGWDWKKILTFNQWEPLFYSLNLLIRAFTSNYRIYWFILYSFYIICILFFITHTFNYKMEYVVIPYFIVGLLYGMCALRSCMANAICLLAFYCLQKKKNIKFIFFVLVATLFHYTAILVLPLVVVVSIGNNLRYLEREKCTCLLIIGIVCIVIMIPIGRYIISLTKYSVYLGNRMTLMGQAPLVCCTLASLIFFNDIKRKYKRLRIYVYMVFYNFLLMPFIVEFDISRISDFFLFPRLLVWTMVVGCIRERCTDDNGKRIVSMGAFIIMMIWMLKIMYDMKAYGIMPYLCSWI